MEIKTCEQFVLSKLSEAENKIERLEDGIHCAIKIIDNLNYELDLIEELLNRPKEELAHFTPVELIAELKGLLKMRTSFENNAYKNIMALVDGKEEEK